jgi:hypothetical protein
MKKISQSAALFWSFEIFTQKLIVQITIDVSPAFLEHCSAEKIVV